ncbi:sigma-54-dependent transcriptional regulator [Nitrococcus mobilis]|uniref:Nitrogen regulation protein NtrX, putative n=1 Tax=Nitrococcus mobilis Nb-231 TaxID=314278 RepID=A4BP79_9GAMM|nr:sigma-54 dependent transcriptional regulator [Nitrococcus mobilis]EAR22380.1 nitrogen regulation protein NtrX, putative [Nitrococcus mobilis Nb-231]
MNAAYVLVVDDEPDIRQLVKEILEDEGYQVATAGNAAAAREARRRRCPDLILLDIWMPDEDGVTLLKEWSENDANRCPVVMISGHGTVETAVEATRLGAIDFIEKPLSMAKLLVTVRQALADSAGKTAQSSPPGAGEPLKPVGHSHQLEELRKQVRRLAASESRVLFSGEPGSGKTCFARYLHALSERRRGPLIEFAGEKAAVELFGYEDTPGRLEAASNGTLVLDEVADLEPEAQIRLVSALEKQEFQRIDGSRSQPLTTRIIALTRLNLAAVVRAGHFREDLYYHLNVVPVHIPPLREHIEDIPDLLNFYVNHLVEQQSLPYRRFNVAAQNRLRNYTWPGNVRELRNLVQRLLILGECLEITVSEIDNALTTSAQIAEMDAATNLPNLSLDRPLREAREEFERLYLQHQLKRAAGSVARLARLTGMERTHLYRKLRALGIDPKESA